jgi:periplasmic protein TonB
MAQRVRHKSASRLSVVISLVLHACIIAALFFFAAREGMLGKELKKIAVTMVPKEKPPEKPKEKPPEPKPTVDEPKEKPLPAIATPEPVSRPVTAPPAAGAAVPVAAPPVAALPAFDFEGGKPVESTSDPNALYKSYVEFSLRSNWDRPEGIADQQFVAEVELRIDAQGRILESAWQKKSGHAAWDASVKTALSRTKSLGRPPPKKFPERVVVRFDVQAATEIALE